MEKPEELPEGLSDEEEQEALAELRKILVGEAEEVAELKVRLDDPKLRTEDVSRVLAEAIALRHGADSELAKSLAPIIGTAIERSVRENPDTIATAIFPIIGPAIQKSLVDTIQRMIESFNQTLENSLSPQSLRWRFEAWRTKRPFAEVVMMHTWVYRVEQVIFVHRSTGLPLQHASEPSVQTDDNAMISSLMTALKDFAQDAFQASSDDALHSFRVGELTAWVESGPQADIAIVVRGVPPQSLRSKLKRVVEEVHRRYSSELKVFDGDDAAFEGSREDLSALLGGRQKSASKKKRSFNPFLAIAATLCVPLLIWLFFLFDASWRWNDYLRYLEAEPGIIVTKTETRDGKYLISGLRDPYAMDHRDLLGKTRLDADLVEVEWEPYVSLREEIVVKRARAVLNAPLGVTIELEKGVLKLSGKTSRSWVESTLDRELTIPGVTQLDRSQLEVTEDG